MSRYIAVFTQSDRVSGTQLAIVCAAIQKQIDRDLKLAWNEHAYVAFSPTPNPAPGWERVGIYDTLTFPNVNGLHAVQNGQPFAVVRATDYWTIDLSHEIMEMIIDPRGARFQAGYALTPERERVEYLVEISDPCQDFDDSYLVDGVRVCNFCTQHYFAPGYVEGVPYSMPNALGDPVLRSPKQIRPYGYLTWYHEEMKQWYWAHRFDGDLKIEEIRPPTTFFSTIRAAIDTESEPYIHQRRLNLLKERKLKTTDFLDPRVYRASVARGESLNEWLKKLSDDAQPYYDKRQEAIIAKGKDKKEIDQPPLKKRISSLKKPATNKHASKKHKGI